MKGLSNYEQIAEMEEARAEEEALGRYIPYPGPPRFDSKGRRLDIYGNLVNKQPMNKK